MNWQELLKRAPAKTVKVEAGSRPTMTIEPLEPPAYDTPGFEAGKPAKVVEQPLKVHMKEQVMGATGDWPGVLAELRPGRRRAFRTPDPGREDPAESGGAASGEHWR